MGELVERVARALCRCAGHDPEADWRCSGGVMLDIALEPDEAQCWRTHVRDARAAIEAMRQPSQDMLWAGFAHLNDPASVEDAATPWRAMIDAALSPEHTPETESVS